MHKSIPAASVNETAFPCPHCGAYANQRWHDTYAEPIRGTSKPNLPDPTFFREQRDRSTNKEERTALSTIINWAEKMATGEPFYEVDSKNVDHRVHNVFTSKCFNCGKPSIWVHDHVIFPPTRSGEDPNPDMPDDVKADYEEARAIVSLSPRGAAALLRLAIQKLCVHLGEAGKDINADIANLVAKGLDAMTAEALDAVRVIGNESVHPGQMDMKDDVNTASELFYAVNFIVEQMVTKRRKLAEIYSKLPPEKRAAIDARNARARAGNQT